MKKKKSIHPVSISTCENLTLYFCANTMQKFNKLKKLTVTLSPWKVIVHKANHHHKVEYKQIQGLLAYQKRTKSTLYFLSQLRGLEKNWETLWSSHSRGTSSLSRTSHLTTTLLKAYLLKKKNPLCSIQISKCTAINLKNTKYQAGQKAENTLWRHRGSIRTW